MTGAVTDQAADTDIFLCDPLRLEDPDSLAVTLGSGIHAIELMVVRSQGEIRAWLNRCPHTGSPLDWMPGKFLSVDKKHIQCAVHDALFRLDDGLCVAGPCVDDRLQAIEIKQKESAVWVSKEVLSGLGFQVSALRHQG